MTTQDEDEPTWLMPNGWKAGDPCGNCGSRDTGQNSWLGAFCRSCNCTDADE